MKLQNYKVANSKDKKVIVSKLSSQWGFSSDFDHIFILNKEGNVHVTEKDVFDIELSKLRVNSIGCYFGEIYNGEIRLSIEGSQLIGKDCKKNIIEIGAIDSRKWLRGEDIFSECDIEGFALIKSGEDYLGCGKVREGRILNFVPKARRIQSED